MLFQNYLITTGLSFIRTGEEIVQDTFLKVWLNRSTLSDIRNFTGWLYRIAANLTLNAIKKERLHQRTIQKWLKDIHDGNDYPDMANPACRMQRIPCDSLPITGHLTE